MPINPIDPVTAAPASTPRPKAPEKSLNQSDFGALVTEDLKAGLRPGPKMNSSARDGFKSLPKDQKFLPLNRAALAGPVNVKPVEALGAGIKHPVGPQRP